MTSLNLPNILAILRILLAPLMLFFFVSRDLVIFENIHYSWLDYAAAFIFVIASVTDFFDGFIARSWNQITVLGSILDPLADKLLVLAGFIGLVYIDRANVWVVYLILSREFFITGLRVVAISQNKDVSASFIGKSKTVAQMFAIGFLTMDWTGGTILLYISLFLSLYSAYEYVVGYAKKG
ncbi:MAG: CDP-diacylglycerol--glycerol-3-phosphate 3-phosphatidyltransferase (EC [uncultured Campylobacterales bacterium]|uniref:CDP-diacylglycerol--glycerol-3-phosphate 3-phosphatidyltransferase n=1 Tax=uncultured Campylobacterales bacterium TaxID=352960 RepID=A0A6S6SWS4_9BACT|nr:MAG: CDP-diacylglycerol--glycerol-3-phosphate 3-phosphatidyltransferase (EC [uncultured Campylobacterales bacterium]